MFVIYFPFFFLDLLRVCGLLIHVFQREVDPGGAVVLRKGTRGAGRHPVRPKGGRKDTRPAQGCYKNINLKAKSSRDRGVSHRKTSH